ncbi:hypothetical protein Tco_1108956 [Tanacetum coccineum]
MIRVIHILNPVRLTRMREEMGGQLETEKKDREDRGELKLRTLDTLDWMAECFQWRLFRAVRVASRGLD